MGEMEVPAQALDGASMQRAVLTSSISANGCRAASCAAPSIKLAAATNAELGSPTRTSRKAIAAAAASVADGDHARCSSRRSTSRPDGLGYLDGHEQEPGCCPPRCETPRRRPGWLHRTSAGQSLPELQRRHPDRVGAAPRRWPSRKTCCPPPRTPPHRPCGQGAGLAGRSTGLDPPPGRHPLNPACRRRVPRLRGRRPGIQFAGHGRRRPSCSRSRWAGPRSGQVSTPIPSTRSKPARGCRA